MPDAGWSEITLDDAQPAAAAAVPLSAWIPSKAQRLIDIESRAEARAERKAAAARQVANEARHDQAIADWRQRAALAGDEVSVFDLIDGRAGVSLPEYLAKVREDIESRDAYLDSQRAPDGTRPEVLSIGEVPVSRSVPQSRAAAAMEADRMLAQAAELNRARIELTGRHYRAKAAAAEARRYAAACAEIGLPAGDDELIYRFGTTGREVTRECSAGFGFVR